MQKSFRKILSSSLSCMVMASAFGMAPVSAADNSAAASPIKHTVVIFQENRSFDNYFGTYPNAPGFNPISGTQKDVRNFKYVAGNELRDVTGNVYNPDDHGNPVYPWHDAGKANVKQTDVNHNYFDMITMVNGGKMDKFYIENSKGGKSPNFTPGTNPLRGKLSMSYNDYNDIPALWQYAQHYSLADNYFQPVSGPSTPGAFYLVAAQSGNDASSQQITGDPNPKNGPFGGDNWDGLSYNLTYKNIGDLLTEANKSWAWYAGGWDAAKAATNATKPADQTTLSTVSPDALKYSPHHNPFQYFQNYEDGKYISNLKDYNSFEQNIKNGTLPQVSFVKGGYGDDEHPGLGNQSSPSAEDFTVKTIKQIMNSPYWKDTAIIVTYDEGGGFYDHVAPSAAIKTGDGLVGNGPRVPALVISPYAKQNYVSHVQYDHTSVLKFLETNYNLPALNNRDSSANNLNDMFDFNHPNFAPYIYQDGSTAYHNINGEIDLSGVTKENTIVTLNNTADNTVLTATYGQILSSQYGDYGVTASVYDGKLHYHFQVPAGNYEVSAQNGGWSGKAAVTANSTDTMNYNGVTFFNDTKDIALQNNVSSGNNLSDIDGNWAAVQIQKLIKLGAITGYKDGTFKPDNQVTRAEFTQVLIKALGLKVQSGQNFKDTANHWAKDVIATAYANGIVNGMDPNTFAPDSKITREQMAVIIVNAMKIGKAVGQVNFSDKAAIDTWAQDAIAAASAKGIIHGYKDQTFKPKANATRAEAVTIIASALDAQK